MRQWMEQSGVSVAATLSALVVLSMVASGFGGAAVVETEQNAEGTDALSALSSSYNVSTQQGLTVHDGSAYVVENSTILTVDLDTGEVVNSFAAPDGRNRGLAYGNGSLWFADGVEPDYDGEIVELDPETGAVRSQIDTSYDPRGLAFGDGSLWAVDITGNNVVEYAPDGTELSQFDTQGPTGSTWGLGLAYAQNSVWFGTHDGGVYEFATNGTLLNGTDARDTSIGGLAANETTLFGPDANGKLTVLNQFGTSDESTDGVTTRLAPASESVRVNETVTYQVVVENVDDGVGSAGFEVSVNDTAVAEITSIEVNSGFPSTFTTTELASNGSSVFVQVAGGDTADTGPVTVANVTVHAESVGAAAFDLSVDSVGDEAGLSYTIAGSEDATLSVTDVPDVTVVGTEPATDGSGSYAGDGVYQDVNGDGSVTLADVTAIFSNYNSDAVQNNARLFDYNGDGSISLADITTLFNQVSV